MSRPRRVVALGFFDGVHKGHAALLRRVVQRAGELDAVPAAFTFDCQPLAALTGEEVPLLTDVEDRVWLMRRCYGMEEVIVASFSQMMNMDWRDFVAHYLREELGAVHVVAGHDFRFGYRGQGTPAFLRELCGELGMGCDIIDRVEREGITVSSTYIRSLVSQGEMERAADFLGHPHILGGKVERGKHLGSRGLGYPTVNLSIPRGVVVPAHGVYACRALLPGGSRLAVTNVGVRPTVDGEEGAVNVEGYLLDYSGDLYGAPLRMEFYHRLREERRFPTLEALSEAIRENVKETRAYFVRRERESSTGEA